MTEFFIIDGDGKELSETTVKWNDIPSELSKVAAVQKVSALGIVLNGKKAVTIPLPIGSKGIVQCKYATVSDGVVTPRAHIIGFMDSKGKPQLQAFDFNTGKAILDFPIGKLDMKEHTISFA